jgi:hypothetical protein
LKVGTEIDIGAGEDHTCITSDWRYRSCRYLRECRR